MLKILPKPQKTEIRNGFLTKKAVAPQNECKDERIEKICKAVIEQDEEELKEHRDFLLSKLKDPVWNKLS